MPIRKLFSRRIHTRRTQTRDELQILSPFQQLSVQAYGRPAMLYPEHTDHPLPNGRGRGESGVHGSDTDQGGRRAGHLDPEEHGEGIEKEVLPAYDSSLKRPPRYADHMLYSFLQRTGLDVSTTGGSGTSDEVGMPDRHPAERDPFEGVEGDVETSTPTRLPQANLNRSTPPLGIGGTGEGEGLPPEYTELLDEHEEG